MTHIAPSCQQYERRQIVSRMGRAGEFRIGRKRYIIWQYMTFFTSRTTPGIAAEFVRPAPIDKEGFLRIDDLKAGEVVVKPGLIYKKIPMSGQIMAEHLKSLKNFKPRDIVTSFKDTAAGPVDLGTIDMRTKQ